MVRTLAAIACTVALGAVVFANAAWAEEAASSDMSDMIQKEIKAYFKAQKHDFRVYWHNGLNLKSGDGNFKMKIGGRIMADFAFFDDIDKDLEQAVGGEWHSGFEFRRARLYVSGQIHKVVSFKAQYDFAGGDADFKDMWIGLTNLEDCLGCMFPDVKVGHFKENFSLEELTSSKYILFMERSLPVGTFAPSRNMGLGLFRNFMGDHMTAGLGVFGDANDYGGGTWTDGGYHVTSRLTWLPWAPCDCEQRFLHVGVAASYQGDKRETRYRTRGEYHIGPRIVDTGHFDADSVILLGGEIAFSYDRFFAAGEWIGARVDSTVADDPFYWGWYAEAGYMLTGGIRPFKRSYATWNRVKPCCNFLEEDCCCMGGWAIAARYSYVNLDEGVSGVSYGGEASDITVGVNWYLNPNTVVKFNYVYVDGTNVHDSGVDGNFSVFGMRFQIDF